MADLDHIFNPKNVAVIGASTQPDKIGHVVLKNIIEAGYKGDIFPVNIKGDRKILGLKAYKDIGEVESEVDLAVYTLPSELAPQTVDDCGKKGVRGMVIISGGFKELGGEGEELERDTVEAARKYGMRIIGPNCLGILNPRAKLDTLFQPRYAMTRPQEGRIGVLTQSGTFGVSILEWLAQENLGISKFVSYGNKADLDELDMLQYLDGDVETDIIAMYVEGISKGRQFMELAARVVVKKPIVMIKAGKTRAGSLAAKSHTGALAGNDAIFSGAMTQSGVISVDDLDELLDAIKLLTMQPLPEGNRIAMVTNGVGPCVVAADEITLTKNLDMAALRPESIDELRASLPDYCIIANPLDITGSATARWYGQVLEVMEADRNIDILLPFFVFQDAPLSETIDELHDVMGKINDSGKTMLCVASGGDYTRQQVEKLQANGIPCIPTQKRAVGALSRVVWYAGYLMDRQKSV